MLKKMIFSFTTEEIEALILERIYGIYSVSAELGPMCVMPDYGFIPPVTVTYTPAREKEEVAAL